MVLCTTHSFVRRCQFSWLPKLSGPEFIHQLICLEVLGNWGRRFAYWAGTGRCVIHTERARERERSNRMQECRRIMTRRIFVPRGRRGRQRRKREGFGTHTFSENNLKDVRNFLEGEHPKGSEIRQRRFFICTMARLLKWRTTKNPHQLVPLSKSRLRDRTVTLLEDKKPKQQQQSRPGLIPNELEFPT